MAKAEKLPRLTEAQIRKLATPQSFERGDRYYRDGAIINPTRQGLELWADCQGSELYQPRATLGKGGAVASDCTCPYDWGGLCKHQVALLLTYVHEPDSFHVLPPLSEMLASRSRDDLVDLIGKMLHRHPELLSLVELTTPRPKGKPIDLATYRRQAQRALRREEMDEIAEDLTVLQDAADQLLQKGDWLSAGSLYQMLVQEVTAAYDYSLQEIDYDGAVCIVVQDSIKGLGLCLSDADTLDAQTRREWLNTLLDAELKDIELGGIDFAAGATDALLENATAEEWEALEAKIRDKVSQSRKGRWEREALVRLLAERQKRSGKAAAANAVIHELGTSEQRAFLLLQEGKLDEATTIAQTFSHLPGLITQFADALIAAGEPERALQFITQQAAQNGRYKYQDWLVKYHQEHSDPQTALDALYKLFQQSPSLPGFQELEEKAKRIDAWDKLRKQILQELQKSNKYALLIDIALHEQDGDRALALLKQSTDWSRISYRERVAKAIEKTQPKEAIALYQPMVQQAIDGRSRSSYKSAAQYLQRIKAMYKALKQQANWQTYIQEIRTKNPTLRALHDELNKAGL